MPAASRRPYAFFLGTAAVLALTLAAPSNAADGKRANPDLPECDGGGQATGARPSADAKVRDAAQRGLDFLGSNTVAWQERNSCYGCHVQAVTLKAMAVGRHHDYNVKERELHEVIRGLTELPGGSRTPGGLRYAHGTYFSAARTLGGSALARYDAWVDTGLRGDLLQTAEQLQTMQDTTGAITNDYTSAPVAIGALQDTVLAMVTWNQAYSRTADDKWLTSVARAEDWLAGQAAAWEGSPPNELQQVNYALIGLHAAQSTSTEGTTQGLVKALLDRQNGDGGWALNAGGGSDAYATGQTLYTLRLMGYTETDPAIRKGTDWLLRNQDADGGWSDGGRERAEAMWAVLGLVSVDVLTLTVTELEDGQHVEGSERVHAVAHDNEGGKVVQVQMNVDDVPTKRMCGNQLDWSWSTASLAPGPHVVDFVATNAAGKTARRRMTVYSGQHWMTRIGSHYEDGGTVISLRNLSAAQSKVQLTISRVKESDGREVAGETLSRMDRDGTQGAMRFWWDGKGPDGTDLSNDRYHARLDWLDAGGAVQQSEELVFVHDTPAAQAARYGQIGGQLNLEGAGSSNTVIELVDEAGRVISETRTTADGNYRFKNVKTGKYKVRVAKQGFDFEDDQIEAEVEAAPAAEASADFDL